MDIKILLSVITVLSSSWAYAHGEDKLGPNGGHIRMPGSFHTELVLDGDKGFKVFLLDIDWKNPVTKNSQVRAELKWKSETLKLECKEEKTFFSCLLPKGKSLKDLSEVILQSTRGVAKGGPAKYAWPLKTSTEKMDHNSH